MLFSTSASESTIQHTFEHVTHESPSFATAQYTIFVLLFPVTEDHPEVQAMVHSALEEARHMSTSPVGLNAEVLEKRVKEVRHDL